MQSQLNTLSPVGKSIYPTARNSIQQAVNKHFALHFPDVCINQLGFI
ncbi:hypothetical protein EHW99_2315 [Erwinia amylovora]|uniref:Uncharacterized protein n=2 Tax=Erwinia amylovora TaxID=552 RepID=A0A830ZUP9_ERWAM|nr:hypothetical protein EaACW_1276 [Erwinia amylovora ACW56400]QJQ55017.1 hypothetical protein EHX00_2315 [Erwinia amylovora]CBA20216.1 hypothetical protein predicted by Glimmer/Critica [Erwinia amylovora CFBP1430]CCO78122.1 hypothetical protein BN432_1312 [Erwinia amylovora Ea356]CCO81909.1 hypothetical protein BN433_1325 [Erwinia amylovora Ea266]CCO85708.1 hypothetical protein BN434_1308 [Erwinia amylovora CFBP 2585]CCO89494.1 hypothetical protein BN435_1310 [Erwinia amylovora 01SFR-BO]CCO